jgi:hypothetical protein
MNNVDKEKEKEKKDNDKGESNREGKLARGKKTPKILVDPQKRTTPQGVGVAPAFSLLPRDI